MIEREDVIRSANIISMSVNDDEIEYIIRNYPGWQASLPMDNWSEVVECMLYFIKKYPDAVYEEDSSTDDCWFDREDMPPINRFHTDGDGDDETLLNFMG